MVVWGMVEAGVRLWRVYAARQARRVSEAAVLLCCTAFVMPREDWCASEMLVAAQGLEHR